MNRKSELDRRVALELCMAKLEVSVVTRCFLQKAIESLAANGEVYMDRFGKFRVVMHGDHPAPMNPRGRKKNTRKLVRTPKYKVHFSKAQPLREAIKEKRHGKVRSRRAG